MSNLTDAKCRAAKANSATQKLRDGNGLYLHVMPSGKYWRYDYRFSDKRRTLSIGVYPDVSLREAREKLTDAKRLLADGIDPSYDKQIRKHVPDDSSFSAVVDAWLKVQSWSPKHRYIVELRVEKYLRPTLGDKPVKTIGAPDILYILRGIESQGHNETAHRVKTIAGQVMRYAVGAGLIDSDPCRDLKGLLKAPVPTHYAAILKPKQFGKLLRAIDTFDNNPIVAAALKLAPYVALRPGELRGAMWDEIDFNKKLWTIPKERMKGKREHLVPLTKQMIAILSETKSMTGDGELVFPSVKTRDRPISDGTLNSALKFLGFGSDVHTPHGFRSTFSTMAHGSEKFTEDVIEIQLAHVSKDRVKAAYNRGVYLKHRRKLMKWWSKKIDAMRSRGQ